MIRNLDHYETREGKLFAKVENQVFLPDGKDVSEHIEYLTAESEGIQNATIDHEYIFSGYDAYVRMYIRGVREATKEEVEWHKAEQKKRRNRLAAANRRNRKSNAKAKSKRLEDAIKTIKKERPDLLNEDAIND